MVFLGITDIGLNVPVLFAQLVNFTFLLIVMRLLIYKPVLKMLDQRRERIREGLSAAEKGQERAEEANRDAQAQIDSARHEGLEIVAQAQQAATRVQEEGRQQAQQQQEAMLARARAEIQLERDTAIAQLRGEFADLTIDAAEKVLGQSLDRSAHQRLIDEALSQSSFREN
jgi:F-type H+-transporting ATPase subunit b